MVPPPVLPPAGHRLGGTPRTVAQVRDQGRESREFASYGFNRGVNKMDYCFHVFISVSFLAVHRCTAGNPVRGYAESWQQPRELTRISRIHVITTELRRREADLFGIPTSRRQSLNHQWTLMNTNS